MFTAYVQNADMFKEPVHSNTNFWYVPIPWNQFYQLLGEKGKGKMFAPPLKNKRLELSLLRLFFPAAAVAKLTS